MSSDTSSDSSDISSRSQTIADKHEESGSKVIARKTVCTENVLDDPYDKKKHSESYISSSIFHRSNINGSYSDSVDTSDLDEGENNRMAKVQREKLRSIETSFNILKEVLYHERMNEVEKKLFEVRLGTAEEYLKPLQELQNQRESRMAVSEALRDFKLTNAKHKYEAEKQTIIQNFENNKEILYDTIKADLEKQIQQLEEARNEADMEAAVWLGRSLKCSGRGRGRGRHLYGHVQPKQKPVIVSGPCIVYNLKEHEILEDWITIKQSLLSSKRKENAEHRYKPYN